MVLSQIILHMCEGVAVNLTDIGGKKGSGKILMSQNISSAEEILLITRSVTGIYEAIVDLKEL